MDVQEFIDVLDELLAVETEEGQITGTCVEGNRIRVKTEGGGEFIVTVERN